MAERIFLREVHLEKVDKTLLFYQSSVGNVNCAVWDAALVLIKYIEKRVCQNEQWLKGSKVVELGAGWGCSGIAAACYGAEVTLTDLPEVVPQVEKTIELNRNAWTGRGTIVATALAWGRDKQPALELVKQPDLILLSDCVSYSQGVTALLDTIKTLFSNNTEILISQGLTSSANEQETWKDFISRLQDQFELTKINVQEHIDQYASQDLVLFRAKKKGVTK